MICSQNTILSHLDVQSFRTKAPQGQVLYGRAALRGTRAMRKRNGGQINNRQAARSKVGRDWQRNEVPPRSANAPPSCCELPMFQQRSERGLGLRRRRSRISRQKHRQGVKGFDRHHVRVVVTWFCFGGNGAKDFFSDMNIDRE